MISPEGFKTILDCSSLQDNPTSGTQFERGHLDKIEECSRAGPSLAPSSFLSVSLVTCRVTALSIKRSMCWLPLNQVD